MEISNMGSKEKLICVNDNQLDENKMTTTNKLTITEAIKTCLYLGIISFGGPIVHIGLFHKIFIEEKRLISEKEFANLFAICNVIPGPTSSQLLTAIVTIKTNTLLGGILSFLCFNMPALIVMVIIASIMKQSVEYLNYSEYFSILNSFKFGIWQAAVALVFQAGITLAKKVTNSKYQIIIMIVSFIVFLIINEYMMMVILMIIGGFISYHIKEEDFLIMKTDQVNDNNPNNISPILGFPSLIFSFITYAIILFLNIITNWDVINLYLMESFYRIGSLIIGGGHVVIPMILTEFKNIISEEDILNAFSVVSLLPGPMFNIAGYIGTFISGTMGGILSAVSIFLPGMLFMFTAIKFLKYINNYSGLQFFLRGVSSAAIGFIFTSAAFLWYESCIKNPNSFYFLGTINVVLCYILLDYFKIHVLFIMIIGTIYSIILNFLSSKTFI